MLHRHAFIDANGVVVQVIVGELDATGQARFLSDYSILFGAEQVIEVPADTAVYIGGSYTDGVFNPPPVPEPLPEPLPEPQPEPEI